MFFTIVITVLTTISLWVARSNSVIDTLGSNGYLPYNIAAMKDAILAISVILQALFLSWPLIKTKKKLESKTKQLDSALQYNKDAFEAQLAKIIGKKQNIRINIRIFVPLKPWYYKVYKPKQRFFVIKNLNGLAVMDTTNDLTFQVEPIQEGLVGKCYKTSNLVWNDDLASYPESIKKQYNLTQMQMSRTCELSFCLCVPICISNKVVAIVAFDSVDNAKISLLGNAKIGEIEKLCTVHSEFLYQYFPDIFDNEKEGF